jgi:uncharacterized protein YdhG (YjbR/CyaY superfamily)
MATKPKNINDYLAALTNEQRAALEKLRKAINSTAPEAQECISYGLCAFRLNGKPLVAFGATANHCAFYLMSGSTVEAHEDDLKDYDTSKGTIRFQAGEPLPNALVRKLVKARLAENEKPTKKLPGKKHVHHHKDGSPWASGTKVNGVLTGYWEWFRKDGTKLRSGHFEKGEQVGEWITYDRMGKPYKVTNMKPKSKKVEGRRRKSGL